MQQRIFQPLGMTSTTVIREGEIVPNRSSGYRIIDGQLKNQEWVAPSLNTTADGGLYTNVLDLAKWDAALYTEKLLKRSSLEQMWTPVKLIPGRAIPTGSDGTSATQTDTASSGTPAETRVFSS